VDEISHVRIIEHDLGCDVRFYERSSIFIKYLSAIVMRSGRDNVLARTGGCACVCLTCDFASLMSDPRGRGFLFSPPCYPRLLPPSWLGVKQDRRARNGGVKSVYELLSAVRTRIAEQSQNIIARIRCLRRVCPHHTDARECFFQAQRKRAQRRKK
jgi:hypothetical protein